MRIQFVAGLKFLTVNILNKCRKNLQNLLKMHRVKMNAVKVMCILWVTYESLEKKKKRRTKSMKIDFHVISYIHINI